MTDSNKVLKAILVGLWLLVKFVVALILVVFIIGLVANLGEFIYTSSGIGGIMLVSAFFIATGIYYKDK